MAKFESIIKEHRFALLTTEQKEGLLPLFQRNLRKNRFGVITEQEDVDMEMPEDSSMDADMGDMGDMDSEVDEPEEPVLDNKPYEYLAYIAYRALLLNPADISENEHYRSLTATDISSEADIGTQKNGLKIFQAIAKIVSAETLPNSSTTI